jgi:hypothetical protein
VTIYRIIPLTCSFITYYTTLHYTALYSMKVDQSMITGESEPVESVVNAADPNSLEARNIIFNGSLGTYSTARHCVVLCCVLCCVYCLCVVLCCVFCCVAMCQSACLLCHLFNACLVVSRYLLLYRPVSIKTCFHLRDFTRCRYSFQFLTTCDVCVCALLVVDGGCLAVVIRTGDATLIGTMVELT